MWCGVDEVSMSGECSSETNAWTVESDNEDLWMGIEGVRDVKVVRNASVEYALAWVLWAVFAGCFAWDGDIGTAMSQDLSIRTFSA